MSSTTQKDFDTKYITSGEVLRLTGTARSTLMIARTTGRLPGAIKCNGGFVWEREAVAPHLQRFMADHTKSQGRGWNPATNSPE